MAAKSGVIAPIDGITPDNRGGVVLVFSVAAGSISVAFAFIRFGTASYKRTLPGVDDITFLLSLAFAIAQVVAIGYAEHAGLGRHESTLSPSQISSYFKDAYVARILAVVSIGLAKCSVCFLYRRLDLYPSWRRNLIPLLPSILWTVFALFVTAFQCHLPAPWLTSANNCPSGPGLTAAVTSLNCLTDLILVVFPIPALWVLTMPTTARLTVISLFSARLLVIMMAIIDVSYSAKMFDVKDRTWNHINPVITSSILVNLSLIHATIPRLYGFLAAIPSGAASSRLPPFLPLTSSKRSTPRNPSDPTPATSNHHVHSDAEVPRLVPDYPNVMTTHISSSNGGAPQRHSSGGRTGKGADLESAASGGTLLAEEEKRSAGSTASEQSADGIHKRVSVEYHVKNGEPLPPRSDWHL